MDRTMEIAKKHDLHVIEDCAEGHGSEWCGKRKDGSATAAEGRIELRIPFDKQNSNYTITVEIAGGLL